MSKNKTIAVCCDTPLIWTFAFSGAEWYCRVCKSNLPMLNAQSVESTPELERQKEENDKWFKEIRKDYISPRSYRVDCSKCEDRREYHILHADEEEKQKSKEAYSKL